MPMLVVAVAFVTSAAAPTVFLCRWRRWVFCGNSIDRRQLGCTADDLRGGLLASTNAKRHFADVLQASSSPQWFPRHAIWIRLPFSIGFHKIYWSFYDMPSSSPTWNVQSRPQIKPTDWSARSFFILISSSRRAAPALCWGVCTYLIWAGRSTKTKVFLKVDLHESMFMARWTLSVYFLLKQGDRQW